MKKSIKLFLILVLLFFVTDRLVYIGIRSLDEKVFSGQSGGKVNHFLSLKDSVNLLVFGSSRAFHHVDTKALDSLSYNMGADGTRIGYSAALISSLDKQNQTILVHIDPVSIYNPEYVGKDILGLLNIARRNENVNDFLFEVYPDEVFLSKIFNSYVYNGKILGLLKNYLSPKYNHEFYSGYEPIVPTEEQKQIFKKLINKTDFTKFVNTATDTVPNPMVDKFIAIIKNKCLENNSKLVFFTSPTLKKNDDVLLRNVKEYFDSKDVVYFDFSQLIDISDTDNWKDFTHLSGKGASIFTKELQLAILDK